MTVIICGGTQLYGRHIMTCPACKHRGRVVEAYAGLFWGSTFTCCTCGDAWADGEFLERPFRRGWRKEATARAKKNWRAGVHKSVISKAVRQEIDDYLDDTDADDRPVETVDTGGLT